MRCCLVPYFQLCITKLQPNIFLVIRLSLPQAREAGERERWWGLAENLGAAGAAMHWSIPILCQKLCDFLYLFSDLTTVLLPKIIFICKIGPCFGFRKKKNGFLMFGMEIKDVSIHFFLDHTKYFSISYITVLP